MLQFMCLVGKYFLYISLKYDHHQIFSMFDALNQFYVTSYCHHRHTHIHTAYYFIIIGFGSINSHTVYFLDLSLTLYLSSTKCNFHENYYRWYTMQTTRYIFMYTTHSLSAQPFVKLKCMECFHSVYLNKMILTLKLFKSFEIQYGYAI